MNKVLEAIKNRRSVRSYETTSIPKDILNTIIEAGNEAPSGGNRQPWRFVVVEDPEFRQKLQKESLSFYNQYFQDRLEALKETDPKRYEQLMKRRVRLEDPIYHSAPVVLFVIGTGDGVTERHDCPMVCQNIMLAAHSLGVGSCWVGLGSRVTDNQEIVKGFKLKDNESIYGPIILGYPKDYPKPPPKKGPVIEWI